MGSTWQDKDKRRALLLSLFLHSLVLLSLFWLWTRPQPLTLDTYLVIDVGTPELSETVTDAPTADAPAPQAAEPLVAAPEAGEPVASSPPAPSPSAPSLTEQPETPQPETAQPEPSPPPEPVAEPTQAEPAAAPTEPQASATPQAQIEQTPEPPQAAPSQVEAQAVQPPTPAARVPDSTPLETPLPPAETNATTLPEIDQVELSPQPLAQALPIPKPAPEASVVPALSVAVTPSVRVAPEQAVPQPVASAAVAAAQAVPRPQASASVTAAESVPQPQVSASVTAPRPVPQPQVTSAVAPARVVPRPEATSSVTPAQTVPRPEVASSVTPAQIVPQPQVQASVAASQAIPTPSAQASVTPGRSVAVTPQVAVSAAQPVPQPQIVASVAASQAVPQPQISTSVAAQRAIPQPQVTATATVTAPVSVETLADVPTGETASTGPRSNSTPGGNAARSGQTTAQEDANAANLGAAAGPDGAAEATGSPLARVPYQENLERPLAIMLDNVGGYPQAGLAEASMIVEMPVEGGLTRLMTVYDRVDPAQVGPVRSARDYFLTLAQGMNGILVHDGGSPAALAAISRSEIPTLNAYSSGTLFERSSARNAPYNLYSSGSSLRQAINRLKLEKSTVVSGTRYRPEDTAQATTSVSIGYSATYTSAFRYVQDLDLYRWVRDGQDAADASGEAVFVDAVLVASIEARPIPDDPEGRLYIPLRGGKATLYLRGRAIPGRWDSSGGVSFVTSLGDAVDLAPFKTWVLFAPSNATVVEQ